MEWNFKALTLSYKTAPVEIRELVALDESAAKRFLQLGKEVLEVSELLVVSTCNRTEFYYTSEFDLSEKLTGLLSVVKGNTEIASKKAFFTSITDAREAVIHLFRMSIGLESQVVGDIQISHQVKNSYQWSADAGLAGAFLHRLLHAIFFTNKKVFQETAFRDGAASVAYATTELVRELAEGFRAPKVLIIGMGEMGADVARNLRDSACNVTLCNRTHEKAVELANECNYSVLPLADLSSGIADADLIVCSVAVQSPLISLNLLKNIDFPGFRYFIDLSMPRSIEQDIEKIHGAVLFNIDQINNRTQEAIERRKAAVPQVEAIIEQAVADFEEWSKEMLISPTIQKLKIALEQIRQEEIARYMKQLSEDEAVKLDKITKGMMQKIIKLPVLQLKAACKRGEADTLLDILNNLFSLDTVEIKKS
jgi:glutamyl-tRNA reductase